MACSVCTHELRDKIDKSLIRGDHLRAIAARFGTTKDSLYRHRKAGHLEKLIAKATKPINGVVVSPEQKEISTANDLVEQLDTIAGYAKAIYDKANKSKQYGAAVASVGEMRRVLELVAKIKGEIIERHMVLNTNPDWFKMQTAIVGALEPFPQAKAAVIEAIKCVN